MRRGFRRWSTSRIGCTRRDGALILCGALPQPAQLMRQAEFHEHVGEENICPDITAALDRAPALYASLPPRVQPRRAV